MLQPTVLSYDTFILSSYHDSQGRSDGEVTRLRARRQGFDSRQGRWRDFLLFAIASRLVLGPTQPLSNGYRG